MLDLLDLMCNYGITEVEITFIESMVRPMDLNNASDITTSDENDHG